MAEEIPEGEGREDLQTPPPFFPYSGDRLPDDAPSREPIQVKVEGLYGAESREGSYRFVVLSDGFRQLKIQIGPFEALAIVQVLEERRPERPLTHDLVRNILDRLEAPLLRVAIDDFWNSVYYAKLFLDAGGLEIEIDSRPSDAIALALRFDAPIFVAEHLLEEAFAE